jgi:hypothetical protein
MKMKFDFSVLIDHFQFYIVDANADRQIKYDLIWDEHSIDLCVAVAPGLIAIGTARYGGCTHVSIELNGTRPVDALESWDQVVECGISISSGDILVTGPEGESESIKHITLPTGDYSARVYFANLDAVVDEMSREGQDHYRIVLWKGSVLKPAIIYRK